MGWVKIDDQAPRHEKLRKAGPAAAWLWVCGLAHCQSQLTDGRIPVADVSQLGLDGVVNLSRLCRRLVEVGLWEKRAGCYLVHDYLNYNQSREIVLAKRADHAARQERYMTRIRRVTDKRPSHPIPSSYKKRARARLFEKTEETKAEQLAKLKAWNDAHPEAGGKADADSPRRRDH